MSAPLRLPQTFLEELWALEDAYLQHEDPISQSGFGGGLDRWRAERSPILEIIDSDGDLLDVGCANGYLLECLVAWAADKRISLTPYGVDINPGLVVEAMRRWPGVADHFWVANAWDWQPPKRFRWVYALSDCVPEEYLPAWVARLLDRCVEPNGRLILGDYGSRSRRTPPRPLADMLTEWGFSVGGSTFGGQLPGGGPVTAFAWIPYP